MKLYYVPRTRSTRARWVLEELGVPYELARLDPKKGETRTPEHLARQPLGHVPALEDGDVRMFESGAICLYLAERYGGGSLLPAAAAARAAVYQWMFFGVSEIESALTHLGLLTHEKPEAEQDRAAVAVARERIGKALAVLERAVAGGGFVAGPGFTVADVLMGSLLNFAGFLGAVPPESKGLAAYLARLKDRPAYRRATAD